MRPRDCIVVGAGIQGLCTAFWLHRFGVREIAVVDRFAPGHQHGSSHGATRITRSSYGDPHYVAMATAAATTGWPALEQALARPLRVPTPGLFFGPPDGPFGAYLRATLDSGAHVEALPPDAARRRFPLLRVDDGEAVLCDHTAAVVLASATMHGLREWLETHGVVMAWNTRVQQVESADDGIRLHTNAGELRTRTAVLAAGPWLRELGTKGPPSTVLRQEVGYFDVDVDSSRCAAGEFPVWARIGRAPNDFQYGLPSHEDSGLKIATHRTEGRDTDPSAPPPPIDEAAVLQLARDRLTVAPRGPTRSEHCLYTMSPDQGFHVAPSPMSPAIVVVAACSGHAFKFGPVIGQMAANLVRAALVSI